jgi:hypothetical protein
MKPLPKLAAILLLITFFPTVPPTHAAVCTVYQNSRAMSYPGHGFVCMGTGGGCQECINQDGGGAMVCVQDVTIKICIDYQW